jgi:hypothetical protein
LVPVTVNSEYMMELRAAVDEWSEEKIKGEG